MAGAKAKAAAKVEAPAGAEPPAAAESPVLSVLGKRLRAIKKKLKNVEVIEALVAENREIDANQVRRRGRYEHTAPWRANVRRLAWR
jgi:hypothetical protein